MKTITPESMQKRLEYLRRKAQANDFACDSDKKWLLKQQRASQTQVFICCLFLVFHGMEEILGYDGGIDYRFFVSLLVSVFLIYPLYLFFRVKWALEAFEHFSPQSISDLEKLVTAEIPPESEVDERLNRVS